MKILSLSGFVPECFCDTIRFTGYAGERNISHYCGYASDFISQVIYDDSIDGAVFPKSCDSTRIMKSYLDGAGKFVYQLPVPARDDEAAIDYLSKELRDFERKLCEHYHLDDIDIEKRIAEINKRNGAIRNILMQREGKSFYSIVRQIHDMLKKPLFDQTLDFDSVDTRAATGKRVYVAGSFLSNESVVKLMEESGLTIVGDDLPESGRMASRMDISAGGDLYQNVAKSILTMRKSPTQDQFQDICDKDLAEVREKKAGGVIFVTQKYCEAYDYLYYRMKGRLDESGIPSLQVSLSDSGDEGKARLKIEAFADMI